MDADTENQDEDTRPAWTAPVLRVVDLKEITKGRSGSFPEGGNRRRGRRFSDVRLKTDVGYICSLSNGLGLYHFRYRNSPEIWVGVMAQEVLAQRPDAVSLAPNGYLMVDYGLLGIDCEPLGQWFAGLGDRTHFLH